MSTVVRWFGKKEIQRLLPYAPLIDALRVGFQNSCSVPLRHHHQLNKENDELLIMPAWNSRSLIVKIMTLCPQNVTKGILVNNGLVTLFDSENKRPLAIFDASEVTARRTAAASALASDFLSRQDSQNLLVLGTGHMALYLIEAHISVRPIKQVYIWGRNQKKTENLLEKVKALLPSSIRCDLVLELSEAVRNSCIISAATRSKMPIIKGVWISNGTHLDLVGGYRSDMREVDSYAVQRSSVFADTIEGVMNEAGDIKYPINNNEIRRTHILAQLSDLCSNRHQGRKSNSEITLFKSVGTAQEDLIAVQLALSREVSGENG